MTDADAEKNAALQRIAVSVRPRLWERTYVRRRDVRLDDWLPERNHCHDNVAYWVARNPGHKQIFGFLLFDLRLQSGCVRITAHSVVEDEKGTLFDITPPHEGAPHLPFLRHEGSDGDFTVLAREHQGCTDVPVDLDCFASPSRR